MRYKLLDIIFILILFLTIILNYLYSDHIFSFGYSFFFFDEDVKIRNILSNWSQSYNFGEILIRNNVSLIPILFIKKYLFGNI